MTTEHSTFEAARETCGCGRTIPAETLARAAREGKGLRCTSCGARLGPAATLATAVLAAAGWVVKFRVLR